MVALALTVDQIIALVRQLSPDDQRRVLQALIASQHQQGMPLDAVSTHLRELCQERGVAWDTLSSEERKAFIDSLPADDPIIKHLVGLMSAGNPMIGLFASEPELIDQLLASIATSRQAE